MCMLIYGDFMRNSAFRQIPAYLENFFVKVLSKILKCIMKILMHVVEIYIIYTTITDQE